MSSTSYSSMSYWIFAGDNCWPHPTCWSCTNCLKRLQWIASCFPRTLISSVRCYLKVSSLLFSVILNGKQNLVWIFRMPLPSSMDRFLADNKAWSSTESACGSLELLAYSNILFCSMTRSCSNLFEFCTTSNEWFTERQLGTTPYFGVVLRWIK